MDMKGLKLYMIIGIIFVSVLGTFLHFAYSLSGDNIFVGFFTPVNESIWEHTKLIYFPMLLYSLYLSKKLMHEYPCILSAMISGTLLGVLLIIILFYTYSGIIGFNFAFADISIFYISVISSFYFAYKKALSCKSNKFNNLLYILIPILIGLYIVFTVFPPAIPLFVSP